MTDEEARAIRAEHGEELVYRTRWGEWRTRIVRGRCGFFQQNSCTLYDKPYYPAVCRGFPWVDAETGGPYEFDRTICPEFSERKELLQINPFVRRRA